MSTQGSQPLVLKKPSPTPPDWGNNRDSRLWKLDSKVERLALERDTEVTTGPKVNRESRCECMCVSGVGGQSTWSKSQNRAQGEILDTLALYRLPFETFCFRFLFSSEPSRESHHLDSPSLVSGPCPSWPRPSETLPPSSTLHPVFVPQLPSQTPIPHRLSQSHRLGKASRGKLNLKKVRTS